MHQHGALRPRHSSRHRATGLGHHGSARRRPVQPAPPAVPRLPALNADRASRRSGGANLAAATHRLLLWLWKVLPLPQPLRRAYLTLTHPRFLIGVIALILDDNGRVLILEHTYRREY